MKEIMNFKETMYYLKTAKSTLYRLLQEGKVPAEKKNKRWRISRKRLNRWMDEHENMNKEGRL